MIRKLKTCSFCFKDTFREVFKVKPCYHACRKCLKQIKYGEMKIDWRAQGFSRNPMEYHYDNGEDGVFI